MTRLQRLALLRCLRIGQFRRATIVLEATDVQHTTLDALTRQGLAEHVLGGWYALTPLGRDLAREYQQWRQIHPSARQERVRWWVRKE